MLDAIAAAGQLNVALSNIPSQRITLHMGRPVSRDDMVDMLKQVAESNGLKVTTSRPLGAASWSWTSDRTIQFRPRTFWPAHLGVKVTANLSRVHAGPGLWGMQNTEGAFRIGRSFVMRVSNAKHRMTVTKDGVLLRTLGVSLGKPGFPTRSGTKVIMEKYVSHRMNSITVGITGPEAYDLDVPYAMRITSSGEFLHGAPWNPYVGVVSPHPTQVHWVYYWI